MSEYQFYEFKSIDKPLSKEDKNQIGTWSSRTNPTNTGAIFTYSYGDFPKDEISVVEKYFDAMFYISNWGTVRLIFKFPKEIFEVDRIKQYCIEDGLKMIEKSNCFILELSFSEEEGGRWIDGEGWLASLVSLREDIMNGDYRSLYLIWLKNSIAAIENEWDNSDENQLEPPVPIELSELNGALHDFIEIFDIDKDYIVAAIENSPSLIDEKTTGTECYIEKLSESEKHEFLVRLLNNEALLSAKLRNRLKELSGPNHSIVQESNRRSVGELAKRVEGIRQERKIKKKKEKEEAYLQKMNDLKLHQNDYWTKVYQLIADKNSKAYDEAIKVLKDLKELSIHQGSYPDYCNKIDLIKNKYSRLSGLTSRISDAKLI